tara:strand:- start:64 stop:711 length:648 start_codon:yes stop_codon:yes gene_type:complete
LKNIEKTNKKQRKTELKFFSKIIQMIIGLLGKNRVGKDTFAEYLINNCGFVRYAFADPIKDIARILFNFSEEQLYGNKKEDIDIRYGISPRQFFQKMGTEIMQYDIYKHLPGLRETVPPREMWVVIFREWYKKQLEIDGNVNVVISDVRFFHELRCIKELGGMIVKIIRPSVEIKDEEHQSEIETQQIPDTDIDKIIINDSSIENFHHKIKEIIG